MLERILMFSHPMNCRYFGGGGFTVQGGMGEEEYRRLLEDERSYTREQEERYQELLLSQEQARLEMEEAQQEQVQIQEQEAFDALQAQEQLLFAEITAQEEAEAAGTGQGSDLTMDFFGSLYEGVTGDEEQETPYDPDTQPE